MKEIITFSFFIPNQPEGMGQTEPVSVSTTAGGVKDQITSDISICRSTPVQDPLRAGRSRQASSLLEIRQYPRQRASGISFPVRRDEELLERVRQDRHFRVRHQSVRCNSRRKQGERLYLVRQKLSITKARIETN